MARRKLIAGNWKMNGLGTDSRERVAALGSFMNAREDEIKAEVLVCPPFTQLASLAPLVREGGLALGGQDCSPEASGAFTGDISAEMLKDAGCSYVIVGHSERRWGHGETDTVVASKAKAAWRTGLSAIICVGEREADRDVGNALDVVKAQLAGSLPEGATVANTVIAYEPVWAIGTGKTAKSNDIKEMHEFIRKLLSEKKLAEARILYGGSVKADNAKEIFGISDVDGVLVGGASLKINDFTEIILSS